MKKFTKLIMVAALAALTVIGLAGCSSSKSYTFNVETGDQVKIELDTTDGYKLEQKDGEFFVTDKDKNEFNGYFGKEAYDDITDDIYENHPDFVKMEGKNTICVTYEEGGTKYLFITKATDELTVRFAAEDMDAGFAALEKLSYTVNDKEVSPAQGLKKVETEAVPDESSSEEAESSSEETAESSSEEASSEETSSEEATSEEAVSEESSSEEASSEQPSAPAPVRLDGFTSEDWKDFEIAVDNAVVKLPTTYKEFSEATGFVWEDAEDGQQTLKDGYEMYEWLVSKDDQNRSVCVYFLNDSGSLKNLEECVVFGVYTYPHKTIGEKSYADFALANGINGASSYDEVKEAMGIEPHRDRDNDGAKSLEYYSGENMWDGRVEFDFAKDGHLDTFILKTN